MFYGAMVIWFCVLYIYIVTCYYYSLVIVALLIYPTTISRIYVYICIYVYYVFICRMQDMVSGSGEAAPSKAERKRITEEVRLNKLKLFQKVCIFIY